MAPDGMFFPGRRVKLSKGFLFIFLQLFSECKLHRYRRALWAGDERSHPGSTA